MKRIAIVTAAVLAAGGLGACGSDRDVPQYQGVCVDPTTGVRVIDTACDVRQGGAGIWEYLLISQALNASARTVYVVPVGTRVPRTYVRTVPPSAAYTRGGVPSTGGYSSYQRGGGIVVSTSKPAPKWVEKQSAVKPAAPKWVEKNPNIKPGSKIQDVKPKPPAYRAPYKAPSMPKFRSRP